MEPSAAARRDEDIVALLRAGEMHRAFERLAQRYESKVYRLCCAMLRDPQQARDVAQESLLRVWRALDRFDGRAALSTWIYAITRNRCLSALDADPAPLSLDDEESQAGIDCVPAPQDGADQSALLLRLVDELPAEQRAALRLYYFEDRATAEVALLLGHPVGTVKTLLFRARGALRERLRELGLARPDFDLP